MNTKPKQPRISARQVGIGLGEIAQAGGVIHRLALLTLAEELEDPHDTEAILQAMEMLGSQIGLMAEHLAVAADPNYYAPQRGGVDEWLFPPSFLRAESSEQLGEGGAA